MKQNESGASASEKPISVAASSKRPYLAIISRSRKRKMGMTKNGIRQIEVTDRAIDSLVYELYGLSEEEIRIVEGN